MAGAACIPIQALTKQRGSDQQDETLRHSLAPCLCCWQEDCGCVSQRTGFVSFLGDEGFQFGDRNTNQQLPPSPGCSVSCANGFTQNIVATEGHLYLPAPVSVCISGLSFFICFSAPYLPHG